MRDHQTQGLGAAHQSHAVCGATNGFRIQPRARIRIRRTGPFAAASPVDRAQSTSDIADTEMEEKRVTVAGSRADVDPRAGPWHWDSVETCSSHVASIPPLSPAVLVCAATVHLDLARRWLALRQRTRPVLARTRTVASEAAQATGSRALQLGAQSSHDFDVASPPRAAGAGHDRSRRMSRRRRQRSHDHLRWRGATPRRLERSCRRRDRFAPNGDVIDGKHAIANIAQRASRPPAHDGCSCANPIVRRGADRARSGRALRRHCDRPTPARARGKAIVALLGAPRSRSVDSDRAPAATANAPSGRLRARAGTATTLARPG